MRPALLDYPDAFIWRKDQAYSPEVADVLRMAFARLSARTPTPQEFLEACVLVSPWLDARMAAQQRVRLFSLFVRTHDAEGEYKLAANWTDKAMQEAAHGHAFGELAELLFLHARLQRAVGKFGSAADDLHQCIELLSRRALNEEAVDPALRLHLYAQLATYEFYLEHYEVSTDLVEKARCLIPQAPDEEMSAASALWVHAHLLRTRGLPERALYLALTAAEVHAREASLTSQDRIEVFVADVLLDLAEKVPGPLQAPDRLAFLAQAQTHLQQAEHLAREAKDSPGATLVKLIQLRESRLRGRKEDRVRAIEVCLRKGHSLHDEALLAQGYTLLGQEFANQGDGERAKNCWREALDVVARSEIPALRVPARRALLLASEQETD